MALIDYVEFILLMFFHKNKLNIKISRFAIWFCNDYNFSQKWINYRFLCLDLSGGSDGKESACNEWYPGSIPGLGRSPGKGNSNPLQYSCLENSMDGGACQTAGHGVAKWLSDFTFILPGLTCGWVHMHTYIYIYIYTYTHIYIYAHILNKTHIVHVLSCANSRRLCPALCNPLDCSPPGSPVQGIVQVALQGGWLCLPPVDLPNPGIFVSIYLY